MATRAKRPSKSPLASEDWASEKDIALSLRPEKYVEETFYAATAILKCRLRRFRSRPPRRDFLVKWSDGSKPTWEPEQNCNTALVREFEDSVASRCIRLPGTLIDRFGDLIRRRARCLSC
jgi:hypothetical protein